MAAQNPHIPKYIKDAPWYADKKGDSSDYLAHHRSGIETKPNSEAKVGSGIHDDFEVEVPKVEFKKRKKRGGCANCGAIDHDKRECLEKPRSRKTELIVESGGKGKRNEDVDYDGKRDRWYGYNSSEYGDFVRTWEKKKEEEKKAEEESRQYDTDEEIELKELGLWDETIRDDVKKAEGEKLVRLREDKAVYLENIRNDSVNYDPKSRAIRDDSTGYYNEDNRFVRHMTGEAAAFEKTKMFAWDEKKRGLGNDNFVANPTLADRKIKQLSEEDKTRKDKLKKDLLDRYGTGEGEDDETELEDDVVRSQYPEDVYLGNHTSVWGSYYEDGKWGYRCCRSLEKDSICK